MLGDDNKVSFHTLFYPDAKRGAKVIADLTEGEESSEVIDLGVTLKKQGLTKFFVEDQTIAKSLSRIEGLDASVDSSGTTKWFRDNQHRYLSELGVVTNREEMMDYARTASLHLARTRISAAIEEKDLLVKNGVDAVDEIDKSINVLVMRLREWYSLHHPSFSNIVEDQEAFARILAQCCGKNAMTRECLQSSAVSEGMLDKILESLDDIGTELTDSDITIMEHLAKAIVELYEQRNRLENYITEMMASVAPNITVLAGPLVGARLISLAGSLKELARKPSSTIQVFGAERALFRSLKTGAAPPKHGIIYRVSEINTAPYWVRGKIARALAGKISIAARIDAYSDSGPEAGQNLRTSFLERVEEIKKQHPEPPKEPKPPPKSAPTGPRIRKHPRKGRGRQDGGRRGRRQ